ncbi:MAG: hypothetical protein ACK4UN_00975 [Limisphaerales bacterium]
MKKPLFSLSISLLSATVALAQTADFYINNGVVTTPTTIDARNFVNNGTFYATNGFITQQYNTFNTLNYTNRGRMESRVGFRFDTAPTGTGLSRPAATFNNENGAQINAGLNLEILATNILNRGSLNASFGKVVVTGRDVDVSRSSLSAGPLGGIFNEYWGLGAITNQASLSASPSHPVTILGLDRYTTNRFNQVFVGYPVHKVYAQAFEVNPTNILIQVAVVAVPLGVGLAPNPEFDTRVRMTPLTSENFEPVYFNWKSTNINAKANRTNFIDLSLADYVPSTNTTLVQHFPASATLQLPSYRPSNYSLAWADYVGETGDEPVDDEDTLAAIESLMFRNPMLYSALGVRIRPNAMIHDTNVLHSASVTNLNGRVEVRADNLNLNFAQIQTPNYLLLQATNNFLGSTRSSVISPFTDINLARQAGEMEISGLMPDVLPIFPGELEVWSGRWNDVIAFEDSTNLFQFHLVLVDSTGLEPTAPAIVNKLKLKAPSVKVGDILNVQKDLQVDAGALTISSGGALNMIGENLIWGESLPTLTSLTNLGGITNVTGTIFAQNSTPAEPMGQPYNWIVNHGSIYVGGLAANANNFINSGIIQAQYASVDLRFGNGVFTNGTIQGIGANADVLLTGNNLLISNSVISARKISLSLNSSLTDGGILGNNLWRTRNGFELLVKPGTGDLLGTTIASFAAAGREVEIRWAGVDRGTSSSGYQNNAAVRDLYLDGRYGSLHTFRAVGGQNAMYVENLALSPEIQADLEWAIAIDPNFRLYYQNLGTVIPMFGGGHEFGPALISHEELAAAFGGRISRFVKAPAPTSQVNLRDSKGNIIGSITVNTSLRESTTIDSDGDGVVNALDDFPFDGPVLSSAILNGGAVQLGWNAAANTTYSVWSSTNFVNWQKVTDITSGTVTGPMSIQVPASSEVRTFKVSYSPQ